MSMQDVLATPESASEAKQRIATVWSTVYDPALPLKATAGAVASRLTVTVSDDEPPVDVAEQVKLAEATSEVTDDETHAGDVTGVSASLTFHDTVTSDVYQPLSPRVPATSGVITGAVLSSGAFGISVT